MGFRVICFFTNNNPDKTIIENKEKEKYSKENIDDCIEDIENFNFYFPKSKYLDSLNIKLEELYYTKAKDIKYNDIYSFLIKYPNSKYSDEIRALQTRKDNLEGYKILFSLREYSKLNKEKILGLKDIIEKNNSILKNEFDFLGCEYFMNGEDENKEIGYWILIYKHKKTEMEFSLIPGGKFFMGDFKISRYRHYNIPVREVEVKPFLFCRTETTLKAWEMIMGINPSEKIDNKLKNSYPISNISLYDCKDFCLKTGFSLPSEAQWEYACKAGTSTRFYFGEGKNEIEIEKYIRKHPIGTKKANKICEKLPNGFGLYDLYDNCLEFCEDNWFDSYNGAPRDDSARKILNGYDLYVARGFAIFTLIRSISSTSRLRINPNLRETLSTLRVCLNLSFFE